MFQDRQYARVLYFQGYTRFTFFSKYDRILNMGQYVIMGGF